MSGTIAAMQTRGDNDLALRRGPAEVLPDPTLLDTVSASVNTARDEQPMVQRDRLQDAYSPVVEALTRTLGSKASEYSTQSWYRYDPLHPIDPDLAWKGVEAARSRGFAMPDLPATREEFERTVVGRKGGYFADQVVLERSGIGSKVAGGIVGGFTDPGNVAIGAFTGGWSQGLGVARGMLADAAGNALGEILEGPATAQARERLGVETSATDILTDAGYSAAFGAAFHVGGRVVGKASSATLDRLPVAVRMALALNKDVKSLSDADLARAFRATSAETEWTPDERAALAVVERAGQVAETSPYTESHAGHAAHGQKLQAATEALTEAPTATPRRAPAPSSLNGDVVGYFRTRGYSEAQARGIAAGIHAESGANPLARNPSSGAYGIGQWLGDRQKELFRRYGRNPTLAQQLEFMDWELKGGDHGGSAVRAQADEAAVLDAYIRKFMRPAAGHETDSDIARGMAALGRKGEGAPRYAGADNDIDPRASIDAERMQIDADRARLDADDAMHSAADEPDAIELPQLRRDLFPDERSYREAQQASDAQVLGLSSPLESRSLEGVEFTTAKGSTYRIQDDETTIRDKAPRPEHPGDEGPQPQSEQTYYVTPEQALALAEFQAEGGPKRSVEVLADGRVGMRYLEGKDTGRFESRTVIEPQPGPAVGLLPVETWNAGRRVHFGNPIVEVRSPERTPGLGVAEAVGDDQSSVAPLMAAETASRSDIPESGIEPQMMQRSDLPSGEAVPSAIAAQLDDPNGKGIAEIADSLWHDIRADLEQSSDFKIDLGDGRGERSVATIDAELVAQKAGIDAARSCL